MSSDTTLRERKMIGVLKCTNSLYLKLFFLQIIRFVTATPTE